MRSDIEEDPNPELANTLTRKPMTVFTGPVFRPSDPATYGKKRPKGPYKVPVEYWKVAVIQKTTNTIAAAAFKVGQQDQIAKLIGAERVFDGLQPYTPEELIENNIQTTIEIIEEEAGLNFGTLRNFESWFLARQRLQIGRQDGA